MPPPVAPGLSYHDQILVDNQNAHDYAMKYLARVLHALNAEGLALTRAMQKFAKFLDLPETSSKVDFAMNIAFGFISTLVPALKFAFIPAQEVAASKAALEIAAQLENRQALLIKAGQKVQEGWNQVKPIKEKLQGLKTVPRDLPANVAELNKLDASKKPIRELIEASKQALKTWDTALDMLDLDFMLRLSDLNTRPAQTMLDRIQKLLSLPDFPTDEELDQIETTALWKMIGNYAAENVSFVETRWYRGGRQTRREVHVVGFNNTQQAAIVELFGVNAKRGKYFNAGAVLNWGYAAGYWGVKSIYNTEYEEVGRNI